MQNITTLDSKEIGSVSGGYNYLETAENIARGIGGAIIWSGLGFLYDGSRGMLIGGMVGAYGGYCHIIKKQLASCVVTAAASRILGNKDHAYACAVKVLYTTFYDDTLEFFDYIM